MSQKLSQYLSYLLRHKPEDIGLDMDVHGYVEVKQLIENINQSHKYTITLEELETIVKEDEKQRYRFNEDHTRIKACQGHSIEWVIPELTYQNPPHYLYHGTTTHAYQKIQKSGYISRMKRHHVHMQEDITKAWQSANRWHLEGVVLKIDAWQMSEDGYVFGVSDNDVWCVEQVPLQYIVLLFTDKIKNNFMQHKRER